MTKEEKVKKIASWIDPEERITVDFRDEQGLNAVVTGCNAELVDHSIRDACASYETAHCRSAEPGDRVGRSFTLHARSGAAAQTSPVDVSDR